MNPELATQYDAFAQEFLEQQAIHNAAANTAFNVLLDSDMHNRKILDVGCGAGQDLLEYHRRGAACYGIDASQEMVRLASEYVPQAKVILGAMEDLPYEDNTFDIVVSKYALQTSENVSYAIGEMGRVLKPQGTMIYLAVHPVRQFLEKGKHPKDYFAREIVTSRFFQGAMTVEEPTHTLEEYLNEDFLEKFHLLSFREYADFPSVQKIDGDTFPCFFTVKAKKAQD